MTAKTFEGGYIFKKIEGHPSVQLDVLTVPDRVIIPLAQGFGNSLEPNVNVGDRVKAGQIIARDDNQIASPIHATISGQVAQTTKRNYFKREVIMVEIKGDGSSEVEKLSGATDQWEKLPLEKIEELLYLAGVTSLDRQGIPTRFNSAPIPPAEVENIIVHGAGSEMYNISLATLLGGKNLYNFIAGLKMLKKIMPQAKLHLALNQAQGKLIERIKKLTINFDNFEIYQVLAKYPQGYDEILVPTIVNKKFPYGYSAANIGVIVLNIQAVMHIFEAVAEGKPLIERTIALCGPSFDQPQHVKVRVGTPLDFVLKDRLKAAPARVVLNSLLTGFDLKDLSLPVDRTFSQLIAVPEMNKRELLAFIRPGFKSDSYSRAFLSYYLNSTRTVNTNCSGEERPCIQCGYCLEVCPVRIIPTLLDRYQKLSINETLMRYGIFNCIDCNLCSYVCPSKIPLAANIKNAKAKLIDSGCDHSLCILPKFDLIGLEEYKGVKVTR